jgi:hypothetical protein
VLGNVCVRRRCSGDRSRSGDSGLIDRLAALFTKLRLPAISFTAAGTSTFQRRAALITKCRGVRILILTARAVQSSFSVLQLDLYGERSRGTSVGLKKKLVDLLNYSLVLWWTNSSVPLFKGH